MFYSVVIHLFIHSFIQVLKQVSTV